MDIDKLPHRVLDALRRLGYADEDIERMSPKRAFSEFCSWEGLINWGDTLWGIVEELKKAEK